jgi:lipoprotein-anchoring transpeptidase ErfK/SrfK
MSLAQAFRDDTGLALGATALLLATLAGSGFLLQHAAMVRYERDVNRIAFNDNWEVLDDIRKQLGMVSDSLDRALEAAPAPPGEQPFIVVSIEDRRLWYKQGDETVFTTRVATGSGKTLVKDGGIDEWKFETPRGKLVVQGKEIDPVWVPPDWHFIEYARRRGLGVLQLKRGEQIETPDGGFITVDGNDVVKQYADGRTYPLEAGEGREIVAGGNVIIPPFGTNQRKYRGVLGSHRLLLGDGYALHGTDKPESIGQAVSHGCVRLRNEDIAYLYSIVPVGTPVFIY